MSHTLQTFLEMVNHYSIQHPAGDQYSQIFMSVDQQMTVFHLETLIPVSTRPGRIHDRPSAICSLFWKRLQTSSNSETAPTE